MAVGIGHIDIDLLGVSLHLKNTFNSPQYVFFSEEEASPPSPSISDIFWVFLECDW